MESDDRNRLHRELRIPSTAAIYSHPVHPMLVTFPIAFLLGALLADIVYLWTDDTFWAEGAFWLIAGGAAGGLAAALAGMTDFLTVPKIRDKIRSWSHFLAGITVLAFASCNLVLRWPDPETAVLPWGLFLSGITVVMLAFTGYLGGKLVFHELVGTYLPEEEEP